MTLAWETMSTSRPVCVKKLYLLHKYHKIKWHFGSCCGLISVANNLPENLFHVRTMIEKVDKIIFITEPRSVPAAYKRN